MILVAIPLVLELAILAGLGLLVHESEQAAASQKRAKQIMRVVTALQRNIEETLRAAGGYKSLGSDAFASDYRENKGALAACESELEKLLSTRSEIEIAANLRQATHEATDLIDRAMAAFGNEPQAVADKRWRQLEIDVRAKRNTIRELSAELAEAAETTEQQSFNQQGMSRQSLKSLLGAALVLNVLAALGLAAYYSRGITSRLKVLIENSVRLASRRELLPRISGTDEITDLDLSFHWMAEQLAELQRKERAMIDNATDVICSIKDDGHFINVNPAAKTVWGYDPEDLVGQRLLSIVRESDKERTLACLKEAIEHKMPLACENGIKRKDGTIVEVLWSGGWSDNDRALFCVAHDITERKRIEQLKRDFVAMVSHDLRTPLTNVQCFLEMIGDGMLDDSAELMKRKASHSKADVARLIGLINNLLDIEKLDAGKMELLLDRASVKSIVERSIYSIQSLAEQKSIQLRTDAPETEIRADEEKIVQVLVNLLSNAVKFSPESEVVLVHAFEDTTYVEFRVIDHGRGIRAEDCAKIFDRFEQVELSDSRMKGGSGLGLALCKSIVEAHGGIIGVNSTEGKGSTFWFRIPRNA
ncbi:MAG TPA: ATP-binding protein [Candidatus Obscuribacterales bacterium]